MENRVLIVDDDRDYLAVIKRKIAALGFRHIHSSDRPKSILPLLEKGELFDIALIDMTMPEMDGLSLLDTIKSLSPMTECLMVTAVNEARIAVQCLKRGAYDYLLKPVSDEDLNLSLNRALEHKRLVDILHLEKSPHLPSLKNPNAFRSITTRSRKVMKVLKEAELHAGSEVPMLITGESGTGKELLARSIHKASLRSKGRFTAVNMASLTPTLFEAEFFGHARGAFTGAERERFGYLEFTKAGTVFLDEIGNLPLQLQGKLLRVLQDGEFLKLGSSAIQTADVRFIAATNEDLERLIAQKRFRRDLYYRILGGWVHLPPLRERKEDIPLLVDIFLKDSSGSATSPSMDDETLCLLMEYDYPGNIRELKSIVQSAVNLSQGGPIHPTFLPAQIRNLNGANNCRPTPSSPSILPLAEIEKNHIVTVYRNTGNNKSETARLLEIGLNTLRRKLKGYGIG